MKKLTHIAAPVALTALLSACAVPGPEQVMQEASLYLDVQQALDNPGPGGLQQAVQQAMADNPVQGNLSQSLQQALDNPGPGGLEQAVQQALADNPTPGNLSQAMQNFGAGGVSQEAVQEEVQKAVNQAMKKIQDTSTSYQHLEFVFENLEGREPFKKELKSIFEKYQSPDREITPSVNSKGGITYTLKDPWGIPGDQKRDMQDDIEEAATAAGGIKMPVAWRDEPKPRRFLTDTLTYRSVAATSDIDASSEQKVQCQREIRFTVDTTPLQAQGRTEVWVYNVRTGGEPDRLRGSEVLELIPGRFDEKDGVCEVDENTSWYVMAFTKDTNPRVAEYHEVHATWKGKALSKPISTPIPGEFIKGRPACPPERWGRGADLLSKKLGECSPEEH